MSDRRRLQFKLPERSSEEEAAALTPRLGSGLPVEAKSDDIPESRRPTVPVSNYDMETVRPDGNEAQFNRQSGIVPRAPRVPDLMLERLAVEDLSAEGALSADELEELTVEELSPDDAVELAFSVEELTAIETPGPNSALASLDLSSAAGSEVEELTLDEVDAGFVQPPEDQRGDHRNPTTSGVHRLAKLDKTANLDEVDEVDEGWG